MKKIALYFIPFLFLTACAPNTEDSTGDRSAADRQAAEPMLSVGLDEAVTHEQLRLYPIFAQPSFYKGNRLAANMMNLGEAMEQRGFYVTEKKPYGRMEDSGAVNRLTVQNKTDSKVYLMQGDVVTGGNQDRIVGEDMIADARSIRDIDVFCVEKGRWNYRTDNMGDDPEAERKKKMYAFTGYYNVASNRLRKTVRETGDQQSVWNMVGQLTSENKASTSTSTYAGLEQSESFTSERDAYLATLEGAWSDRGDCVGFVAVSGNEVIGMDLFGHPNLFKKQYGALLHGYVTDAIAKDAAEITVTDQRMESYEKNLNRRSQQALKGSGDAFLHNGQLIHLTDL